MLAAQNIQVFVPPDARYPRACPLPLWFGGMRLSPSLRSHLLGALDERCFKS